MSGVKRCQASDAEEDVGRRTDDALAVVGNVY
jgi:hypothetical protein